MKSLSREPILTTINRIKSHLNQPTINKNYFSSMRDAQVQQIYQQTKTDLNNIKPTSHIGANNEYGYTILKYNTPELERESTLLKNNYKKSKVYALIYKSVYKDQSESITHIEYSNDYLDLAFKARVFVSWYDYIEGKKRDIQGYISDTAFKDKLVLTEI